MTQPKKLEVKRKFVPIELKEGMIVTIRLWDDMKEEFGLTENGHISIPLLFTREMRKYCGAKVTVSRAFGATFNHDGYTISRWMLEECYKPIRQLPDHLKGKL